MEFDKDLRSIQEARDLIRKAKAAQKALAAYDQAAIDSLVKALADAGIRNAEKLARMAQEETGFGRWQDKVLKNLLGSRIVYDHIKDMKTIGVLREDKEHGITEIAVPVGVVVALIPSTNPTSTTLYKTLISIKSGNSIVISPHPSAKNCILETVRILQEAAREAGAPNDIIQVVTNPTIEATDSLMKNRDTGMILATGGEAMVHAAYSSGNPALGVGPGNGPAYIERSADIDLAVKRIVDSQTFDNGTICASEQSIITEDCIKDKVAASLKARHCYFMNEEESARVSRFIMRANNTMNPQIVGRTALTIAEMAGISVPQDTLVLITEHTGIGRNYPYSREKLCPILAFFSVRNWEEACELSIKLLENEGTGHTMTIHSNDERVIREFGLKKPVSRLLVNTPGALGGVGATTGLTPALTLGCGAVGGSATSDNVGPENLFNIRRVARGLTEIEDIRKLAPDAGQAGPGAPHAQDAPAAPEGSSQVSRSDIERITSEVVRRVLAQMQQ